MCSVRIRQSSPARGPPVPRGDDDRGGYARAELDALRPASDTSGAEAAAGAAAPIVYCAVAVVLTTAVPYHGTATFVWLLVTPILPSAEFDPGIAALVIGLGHFARILQRVPYEPVQQQAHIAHFSAYSRTSPLTPTIGNEHTPRIDSNV